MKKKDKQMPVKRTMNLYFKADRTTKPATVALYVIFVAVVLAGLSKVLIYDLWLKVEDARVALAAVQYQLNNAMAELTDYDEVKQEYQRYSATDEERAQVDRTEIVRLIDENIASVAKVHTYTVSGMQINVAIDNVTLSEVAEIVRLLEASPIVVSTVVNTAATTENTAAENILTETADMAPEAGAVTDEVNIDTAENKDGDLVSANIMIELAKEDKTDEETTVSP